MSKRHRNKDLAPPPRADFRAHAHNERHRIHSELHMAEEAMRHGVEPLDIDEPGPEWKPVHHHDAHAHRSSGRSDSTKHWKTKSWKRRTSLRRARAMAWSSLA